MNNACKFCKKEFKYLKPHLSRPPKYCQVIRESFRCWGCTKIIDEPLSIHQTKCRLYINAKDRQELDRRMDIETRKFQVEIDFLTRRIKGLESTIQRMTHESTTAIENKQKEVEFILKRYTKLESDYKELATICASKTTTTTINNPTQNTINQYLLSAPPLDLTNPSKFQLIMEELYTEDHLLGGMIAFAEFLIKEYLLGKYLPCDAARYNFKFNDDGTITTDQQARMLLEFIIPIAIRVIQKKIIDNIRNDYSERGCALYDRFNEISALKTNNTEFLKHLIKRTLPIRPLTSKAIEAF